MLKYHNPVRQLKACETMGNSTNSCSGGAGTLTQNKMAVVAGTIGTGLRFHDGLSTSGEEQSNLYLGTAVPSTA